jgi:hypothetical protein
LANAAAKQECRRVKPISATAILLGLLVASVLSLVLLSGWYMFSVREYRQVQGELMLAEQNRARMRLLLADCLEYRKRNPAIDPLLKSLSILQSTNRPAGAK